MCRKKLYLLGILCSLLLFACNSRNEARLILSNAESLLDQHPDSALQLLDSIMYPKNLGEDMYNHYLLVQIQAKDKSYQDIKNDSLIFAVKDYYLKENNIEKVALAIFYCGRVSHEQKRDQVAMMSYLEAGRYAERVENTKLLALTHAQIGDLYYSQMMMRSAINEYRKAVVLFEKIGDYKNAIAVNSSLGSSYLVKSYAEKKVNDSTFYYHERSLSQAKQHNDLRGLGAAYQNIGLAYQGLYDDQNKARSYFKQALSCYTVEEDIAMNYLNVALSYNKESNEDSTKAYIDKVMKLKSSENNPIIRRFILRMQSQIAEQNNDFETALGYQKKYVRMMSDAFDASNQRSIADVQRRYNFELIKNENSGLLIQRQYVFIALLASILALIVMGFIWYWRHAKDKQALFEAEHRVHQLKALADTFDRRKNTFRNILLHHFDILKKTALLEGFLREDEKKQGQKILKKINETVYGQSTLDWDKLYEAMNNLHNGFMDIFRHTYPQLDEPEFKICCLTYAEMSNTEIGIIMGFKINTIQAKKSSIRRKLGIEGYGNIIEFLDSEMQKDTL